MLRKPHLWVVGGLLLVGGGFWLWSKGMTNILFYGMLLLCPLMHLFMHGGHGGHGSHGGHDHSQGETNPKEPKEGEASCH